MRKEVTVILICFLAIFTDGASGWQIVELWRNGEVKFGIAFLYGIVAGQIILGILCGLLSVFLFKRIFRNSSLPMPEISIRFVFEVPPLTIRTEVFETPHFFESIPINSLFAAPSTGGAANFTFNAPPYSPAIPLFDDRGMTRTSKLIESLFSFISISSIKLRRPPSAESSKGSAR